MSAASVEYLYNNKTLDEKKGHWGRLYEDNYEFTFTERGKVITEMRKETFRSLHVSEAMEKRIYDLFFDLTKKMFRTNDTLFSIFDIPDSGSAIHGSRIQKLTVA